MKIKVEFWKETGKWYASERYELESLDAVNDFMSSFDRYKGMTATVYIIESDEYLQPYRMFRL